MEKIKAVLFHYDIESVHFFRYSDMNMLFEPVAAVAPEGFGLNGKGVYEIFEEEAENHIKVQKDFTMIEDVEAIVLVDS